MHKIIAYIIDVISTHLAKYIAEQVKKQITKYKNKRAIEAVKTAETPEEFKDAAKSISDRFDLH